jgi:hypothetical protein
MRTSRIRPVSSEPGGQPELGSLVDRFPLAAFDLQFQAGLSAIVSFLSLRLSRHFRRRLTKAPFQRRQQVDDVVYRCACRFSLQINAFALELPIDLRG